MLKDEHEQAIVLDLVDDPVKVVGIDDRSDPTSAASDVDRLVVGTSALDDRGKSKLRVIT